MATPIGQLASGMPAPMYNVKKDHAPQGAPVSYDEILTSMQPQQPQGQAPPPSVPGGTDPPMYPSSADPTCPPGYDPNPFNPAPTYADAQVHYEPTHQYAYPQYPQQYQPAQNKVKPSFFGQHKEVIVIACIVFFLLFWAQPKARGTIPQLFNSTGSLNVLGMGVLAVASGLIFRVGSDYLPD